MTTKNDKSNTNETPMKGGSAMNHYQTNFHIQHPYGEKDVHGRHVSENKRFHTQKEGMENSENPNFMQKYKERSHNSSFKIGANTLIADQYASASYR